MDQIDGKILAELRRDGRISNAELAERVRLSPSPCLRRVRRLEEEGIIVGYTARLNPDALGFGFRVFVGVTMSDERRDILVALEQQLAEQQEVLAAFRLFGDPDYLLLVGCADAVVYEKLYSQVLSNLPGVQRVTSYMIMKVAKADGGLAVFLASIVRVLRSGY